MNIIEFKKNVCIVEIESSSFCNRKCSYCINYYIDRFSKNEIMPFKTFKKVIDELACIGYDRMLTFHRYNEPFYNQNGMILERISYARKKLPNANLVTSSNSDYLDANYLQQIKSAGLDSLYCQCQTENYKHKSLDEIKESILSINERIGGFKGKFVIKSDSCVFTTVGSGFKSLTIQAKDFINTGFNRGGIVKNVITKEGDEKPCYHPLVSVVIDFNGKVMMCVNTVSYYDNHKDFVIGDINKDSITEIYQSNKAVEIRKQLLDGKRFEICKGCQYNYERYVMQYNLD